MGFANPVSHSRKGSREEKGRAYLVGARRRRRTVEGSDESLGWAPGLGRRRRSPSCPHEREGALAGLNGRRESRGKGWRKKVGFFKPNFRVQTDLCFQCFKKNLCFDFWSRPEFDGFLVTPQFPPFQNCELFFFSRFIGCLYRTLVPAHPDVRKCSVPST